jgi:putative ABC transport system permease protein
MLLSHFKIAARFLHKHLNFLAINVFGLTLGFVCFTLIALYTYDELHFDMFHDDADRMVRVLQFEKQEEGDVRKIGTVAARIAPESAKQLPEVADAIRVSGFGRLTMGNDPANRDYEDIIIADPHFFSFFDFELLEGDPATCLKVPDAVVLSQSLATKYFGKDSPVGKRLFSSAVELTVTGVMKDAPKNSHMQLDLIFSEETWRKYFPWYANFESSDWASNSFITYLKLKEGADLREVESKLTELVKKNYDPKKEFHSNFVLQPFRDIHLHSGDLQGLGPGQSENGSFYLYMFGIVAFLILLIACLNYMNLSTALAYKRTREIGTRKTLGAMKGQLIFQFITESLLITVLSLILAVAIVTMLLPSVNEFTNKEMLLSTLPLKWVLMIGAVTIGSSLLSSLYPAFIISKVVPAEALKREIRIGKTSLPVRKVLVVAQLCVSVMMIACTLIVYQQLEFMRTKELGFKLQNLLVTDINSGELRSNFEAIKAEFSKLSEVERVTVSSRVPGEWKSFPVATVATEHDRGMEMIYVGIDQDFLNTYNINLLEGRNFGTGGGDSLKVILTKLAVEELGLKDPVGKVVEIPSVRWGGSVEPLETPFRAEVIGVCDNFYFESFRQKMMPLVFAYNKNPIHRIDYYTLRINTQNWDETIKKLKAVNDKFDPDNPLEYTFLDARFQEFYEADEKRGTIFLVFSCVIVLIACLGLFALVSFSLAARTKEIGIRKVLGASINDIVGIVSKEFLVLVLIAAVISVPAAYYFMDKWLAEFAYHIPLSMGTFAVAGIIGILIAAMTIGFRIIKAALSNPVDSLKTE